VVEPGQPELDPAGPLRRVEPENRTLESLQRHLTCGDIQRRTCVVAARTAIVAEVTDVRGGIVVRRTAADAVLRVGSMLQGRAGDTRVVETKRDAACVRLADRGELRVVGVVHKLRLRTQIFHRFPPALGNELELAVAVELVAKEVPEAHGY